MFKPSATALSLGRLIGCLVLVGTFISCAPENSANTPNEETTHELAEPSAPQLAPEQKDNIAQFKEPGSDVRTEAVLASYSHVDPTGQVPKSLLNKALLYFDTNKAHIQNQAFLTVVDFSQNATLARLFMIDMSSGAVSTLHVAHGKGSDPKNTGNATIFSNTSGSEASSVGYYLTAETYSGTHGLSLRLDGLSTTNSNVRQRAIVMHGASYVYDDNRKAGRSWGCFAVPMADRNRMISALKGGSLIYADRLTQSE